MKKLFSSLLIVAASLALASCVKEQVPAPDPAQGGEPVNVSFSLRLGDALTKAAPEASAFDSASGEFKLYVAVFSKSNGSLISTSKIGGTGFQPVETITSEKSSVVMTLSRSQDYKVVFFAMHDGAYTVNFADNNVAAFSFKSGLKANDASLDAFYATVDVASGTKTYDVTLRRPFAQLNVLVPQDNVPKGQTAFSSAMSVTAPASFDLFAGAAVDTDMKTIAFADNTIAADAVGAYKGTHKWIGMNFVLVPKSGTVSVASFKESGMSEPVQIGSVPAKVNGRTNMVGQIYSLSDYVFNLEIDPEFGDEQEQNIDENGTPGDDTPGDDTPEDTEISVVDGNTYTTGNPLVITAAQSVRLRVNGDDIATVEKGAGGAKVTVKSADETVAKAAVANNDVVITPVADGSTTVTINTPAYTKASYAAQTLVLPVKVEGMGGDEPGGEETGDVKKVTVAEFNAAAPSATQKYQLTGKISGTINDTYGNFDLVDESGTVYVYGLTATEQALTVNEDGSFKANNDKSYSSLGLKAGDVVTIIGYRAVHNDKVEVLGAYYVSHEAGQGSGTEPGSGGGNVDTSDADATLTHAEILAAVHDASVTGAYATYGNVTISSASGAWSGNVARHPTEVNFIQLRNQQAAQLTSPVFSKSISKVVLTMSNDAKVSSLSDRTLHAVPVGTTLPTVKDDKYSSAVWADQYGSVKTGTTKGAKVTIDFTGDTKQFMLVVEGGATYIDEIAVYY